MGAGAVARVEPLARAVTGKSIRPSLLRSHLVAVSAGVGRSASVDCNAATQRNGPLATTPIGLESVAAARQDSSSSSARSHVGPVMGIFFKVWSLVKGKFALSMIPLWTPAALSVGAVHTPPRASVSARAAAD